MNNKFRVALKSLLWILIPAVALFVIGFIQNAFMHKRLDLFPEFPTYLGLSTIFWKDSVLALWQMAQIVIFVGIPFFIANISLLTFLEKKMGKLLSAGLATLIYITTFLLITYTILSTLYRGDGLAAAVILLYGGLALVIYLINAVFICRRSSKPL